MSTSSTSRSPIEQQIKELKKKIRQLEHEKTHNKDQSLNFKLIMSRLNKTHQTHKKVDNFARFFRSRQKLIDNDRMRFLLNRYKQIDLREPLRSE